MTVRRLAYAAVAAVLVLVATMFLKVTYGSSYFHLGEAVIYATALSLGPRVAAPAAAVGSALADVLVGFAAFAPITLVVKGIEAWIVGTLGAGRDALRQVLALVLGVVTLVLGYVAAQWVLFGPGAAIVELYGDLVQGGGGAVLGYFLARAVGRALPPGMRDAEGRSSK